MLTDFEEFVVYDTRVRPAKDDTAATARLRHLSYDAYPEHWEEIAEHFSRAAVYDGAFDRYAEELPTKRGTATVDTAFLKEIETWRELLARNITLRNPGLSQRELNFAVQMTIDRIIFLRMAEDRGIESYGRLLALRNGGDVYLRLRDLYRQADERYNSGLFHFRPERDRAEAPDDLTPRLSIDDRTLKDIFRDLYYPDSPYEFAVLPVDVLGQVYEQFLGKVIRLTPGRRVVVEEKPEVRKAGGVYYTPTYIVDYIVEHTVGKLLEGKTPRQVSRLKIVDPACGSGSFLIGAYQCLLDWHRDYYVADGPEQHPKELYESIGGEWRLTTAERKRILLNNLYGVDIDPQAVEVTKLSLLLKQLEGATDQAIVRQLQFAYKERVLPDLSANIKCGNSLIGPDFYDNQQMALLANEEHDRINVFNWQVEFPEVLSGRDPGFDSVIGNPPWLMAGYHESQSLEYLHSSYESARGKFDLYYLFIEQGCRLLKDAGHFGMIVPNKLFHTKSASGLRGLLVTDNWVKEVVDFGHEQLFRGATNYSCLLFLVRRSSESVRYATAKAGFEAISWTEVPRSTLTAEPWHFEDQYARRLFSKMEAASTCLESITERFGTGVQSGADRLLTFDESAARAKELEPEILINVVRGRDVRRYVVETDLKHLLFPYKIADSRFVILNDNELAMFPGAEQQLIENRKSLEKRVWFGKNAKELSGRWYGMMYLDSYRAFSMPHILTPSLSNKSNFAIGTGDLFVTGTAGVTSVIPKSGIPESIHYLLGVLNSRLLSFYATRHSPVFSGGYYKFSAPYLKKLPIRTIDFANPADVARHDQLVGLVERMLALHERLAAARTSHDKTPIQRQLEATDRQIDRLVYELYELTDDEIRIVEEGMQ